MPGTMPFIEFDGDGVCNYCRTYVPYKPLGLDALRELVAPFRSRKKDQPDCLVAVSGGRDSCYGLHVLKAELGLNPVDRSKVISLHGKTADEEEEEWDELEGGGSGVRVQ